MSNQRGGGHVILGVSEGEDGTPTPTGLSQETISTWTHDEVSGVVGGYADPHVDFSTSRLTYNGKTFIVYTVNEFDTVPVLCKKDFSDVLRDGALYVRTSNPPASKAVPSHAAMRDVIELATDKNVRQLVSRASDAGLLGTQPIAPPSDNERFYRQLKGTPFE
jgi:predicted HTH transcriptional regulator